MYGGIPSPQSIMPRSLQTMASRCRHWFVFKWAIPGLFFLFSYFSIQLTVNAQHKFCRWLDLNCGPLESEATTLPTEPQTTTALNCMSSFNYGSYLAPSMKRPWIQAPSRGGACISSFCFLVTSQARLILSKGSSFFLAVLCKDRVNSKSQSVIK